MQLHPAWYFVIFALGLVFGSFFNVAIYRWPQDDPKRREWVRTPSHCPACGARIRWYDNIPLVSFLVLRGACRDCGAPISWRYPAVELGSALLWVVTTWLVTHSGLTGLPATMMSAWHVGFALFFASLYLLTVIIDFRTQTIPDEITIAHFAGAWLFIAVVPGLAISPGWQSSLVGMFVLSVFFFLFAWFGGMGMGDVKLAVGLGALFGWQLVIAVGFIGVCLGGAVAIVLLVVLKLLGKYRRGIPIPFGPYLAISAYICLFLGHEAVTWYLSLFGRQL